MPDKLEILEYFNKKGKEHLAINHKSLIKEFGLTASAACHWLSRLQEQGLIVFMFKSKQGNRCYSLTNRGLTRLKWLKKKAEFLESDSNKLDRSFLDDLFSKE